jgi:hypothetical protein
MDYFDGPDGLEERKVLILDELADTKACASISCVLWLRRWKGELRNGKHVRTTAQTDPLYPAKVAGNNVETYPYRPS